MAWYRVSLDRGGDFTDADLDAAVAALGRFGQVHRTSPGPGDGPERAVLLVDSALDPDAAAVHLNSTAVVAVGGRAAVGAGPAWPGDLLLLARSAEYDALRQRCATGSERVLSMQHLGEHETGVPTDRGSALARMRRNVLHGLMQNFPRERPGSQSAGVVVMAAGGGRQYVAPVRMGVGAGAVADALAAVRAFAADGGLLAQINARLTPPVVDPLLGGVFQVLTHADPHLTCIRAVYADGSALELLSPDALAAPTPQTLIASDPVAEAQATIATDPLPAPGFAELAALLTAALPARPD